MRKAEGNLLGMKGASQHEVRHGLCGIQHVEQPLNQALK